jgi:acyl carrier protein
MDRPTHVPPAPPAAGGHSVEEIKDILKGLIEENAGIPAASIKDDSTIDGDLLMDSLSFVSLQVAVDETFGVDCEAEEIEKRNRFDAIAQLIWERLHAEAGRLGHAAEAAEKPVRVIDGRRH